MIITRNKYVTFDYFKSVSRYICIYMYTRYVRTNTYVIDIVQ